MRVESNKNIAFSHFFGHSRYENHGMIVLLFSVNLVAIPREWKAIMVHFRNIRSLKNNLTPDTGLSK